MGGSEVGGRRRDKKGEEGGQCIVYTMRRGAHINNITCSCVWAVRRTVRETEST